VFGAVSPRLLPRFLVGAIALLILLSGVVIVQRLGQQEVHLTAYFSQAIGVYSGSDVRVLGVKIGTITRVQPEGNSVRVDMVYDAKYKVPADAGAVVVAPSVVSDRYVQLTPPYTGGPVLTDGADIPLARTAAPLELDQIYQNLNQLNVALGPEGANKNGALSRLLQVGAANLDGQGQQMNTTMANLSKAVQTLGQGRGDLFGTIRNLQQFTTALAQSDAQVRQFNTNLANVAEQLDAERADLGAALHNLSIALGQVAQFVQQNKDLLKNNVAALTQITGILVKQKAALANVLDVAPAALGNLNLAYNTNIDPHTGQVYGTLNTRTVNGSVPPIVLCEVINTLGASVPSLGLPTLKCNTDPQTLLTALKGALPTLTKYATGGARDAATGAVSVVQSDLTLAGILPGKP